LSSRCSFTFTLASVKEKERERDREREREREREGMRRDDRHLERSLSDRESPAI